MKNLFAVLMVITIICCQQLCHGQNKKVMLDNNLKVVDLRDLDGDLPLDVVSTTQILWQSEDWEHGLWENPKWPAGKENSVGYPTVVKNVHGLNPDGKYYLYYAQHDTPSGIGCAVADAIEGPYKKLAQLDPNRADSQVLKNPHFQGQGINDSSHFSSPCVVWNEDEQLWFMYFHFYNLNLYETWDKGLGHQQTTLATCPDLAENKWTPWIDKSFGINPPLRPVLPTTKEWWMNSQSSYHAVQRLPDGRWLAFLRGTGGEFKGDRQWAQDITRLGFAVSDDGRNWNYFAENPVIHKDDGNNGRKGVYRPHFVGYLGDGEYLLCWSECIPYGKNPRAVYGKTRDFKKVVRDRRGFANWKIGDGLTSVWREGDKLYLFAGRNLHVMEIPTSTQAP